MKIDIDLVAMITSIVASIVFIIRLEGKVKLLLHDMKGIGGKVNRVELSLARIEGKLEAKDGSD